MKNIVVIDGMGGGIGAQIIEQIRRTMIAKTAIIALGANAAATQRMIAAGADKGATGENAIRVTVKNADIVAGPVGIILCNAMMGEITPVIAEAVASAPCKKLLLPLSQSNLVIAGTDQKNMNDLIVDLVAKIRDVIAHTS